MSDLVKQLRASVGIDAINGDSFERGVCGKQMYQAADLIEQLQQRVGELELELKVSERNKRLKDRESQALAAHVERFNGIHLNDRDIVDEVRLVQNQSPQNSLAEHDAEVIDKFLDWVNNNFKPGKDIWSMGEYYANKIRNRKDGE